MTSTDAPLYEQVAARLRGMIETGTLRNGDRAPSIRGMARQAKVSIATVLEAYARLEAEGWLAARPQSGFYARQPAAAAAQARTAPARTTPPLRAKVVTPCDLTLELFEISSRPNMVQMGLAMPADDLLPTTALNRLATSICRHTHMGHNAYIAPPGLKELRVQIARYMLEAGCTLHPDEIIITIGCQEAMTLCLLAATKPGDVIAIESPCFHGHLRLIESLGLRALELPTDPQTGMDLDALDRALERRSIAACLVVTNISNPLGSTLPSAHKERLVKMLAAHEVPLIEDDIYGELYFGDSRPEVAKRYDRNDGVMLCSSFSKTLAPGMRVGWCAPGKHFNRVRLLKTAMTVATPTVAQKVLAEYLSAGGYTRQLRRARQEYRHRAHAMADAVLRYFPAGTRVTSPTGGFVLWVQLPAGLDAVRLARRAAGKGISVAPGPIFSSHDTYRDCLRITCAAAIDTVEASIRKLGSMAARC